MSSERVLCIVSHPDDEVLGCGGTLAKHVLSGDAVMVVILADGVSSRGLPGTDIARRRECVSALQTLGISQIAFGDFPDNQFDSVPQLKIVKDIEQAIGRFKPTIVYTHHAGDLNVDHQVTSKCVEVACRPQPGNQIRKLLYFEVPCSTTWGNTFRPNYYVNVNETFMAKLEAWSCYASEMREWPHARSVGAINALAAHRGAAVGMERAEAFVVGRIC